MSPEKQENIITIIKDRLSFLRTIYLLDPKFVEAEMKFLQNLIKEIKRRE